MMVEARERGFDVVLIYVGTMSSDINVARVADRVAQGGHDVPEVDIRRRYQRSLQNLPLAMRLADLAVLFDNSTETGYQMVAVQEDGRTEWFNLVPSWARSLALER